MGKVVPIGDSDALAEAIIEVVRHKETYVRPEEEIRERWSTEQTAKGYEELFERLLREKG
jgi:glycosyltransferase involved in cell wall biosynthesis